jgi:hypothetical protein
MSGLAVMSTILTVTEGNWWAMEKWAMFRQMRPPSSYTIVLIERQAPDAGVADSPQTNTSARSSSTGRRDRRLIV